MAEKLELLHVNTVNCGCSKPLCATANIDNSRVLIASDDSSINIYLISTNELLLTLRGHHHAPVSLLLADGDGFCSVSDDAVLLWKLQYCLSQSHSSSPLTCRSVLLEHGCGISNGSISSRYVGLCCGDSCIIISNESGGVVCDLIAHSSRVNDVAFLSNDDNTVVTVSDDRTFKVWNIADSSLLYESSIISGSPLVTVCSSTQYLVITSHDNRLFVYGTVSDYRQWTLIHSVDINLSFARHLTADGQYHDIICDNIILTYPWSVSLKDSYYGNCELLLMMTSHDIILLNIDTITVLATVDLATEEVKSLLATPTYKVPFINSGHIANSSDDEVVISVGSLFSNIVTILRMTYDVKSHSLPLTVMEPLIKGSPLKAELVPHCSKAACRAAVKDQPLTFKSKIKSSGYTQPPRLTMFKPNTKASTTGSSTKQKEPHNPLSYKTIDISTLHHSNTVAIATSSPIQNTAFNDLGTYLAVSSNDTIYLYKNPSANSKYSILTGHDANVVGINWSHNNPWLLSCSNDKTAKLWSVSDVSLLMTMNYKIHNMKKDQDNTTFGSEINNALFYYLDKFILLTSGNTLYMYKYHINTDSADDIKRYQQRAHYKLAMPITLMDTHSITSLSSINDFYSYIAILGCSNKTMSVYDLNVSRCVWTVNNCHNRPPHCITQNKGSRYTSCPSEVYDIFSTVAINDGVKLWDLRTRRWYRSHVNKQFSIKTSFSPCGKYIAVPSEDQSVCIYDIRHILPCCKLPCTNVAMTTVAYHPLNSMVVSGSLEGKVDLFTS